MVEAQVPGRQSASVELVLDVACAEQAGREPDQRPEHDEHDVEVVHQQVGAGRGPPAKEQHERRGEGQHRRQHVEPRGQAIAGQQREQQGRDQRDQQDRADGVIAGSRH